MIAKKTGNTRDLAFTCYVLTAFFAVISVLVAYYMILLWGQGNFREVVPQKVYRSGQCSASKLRNMIERHHIRTVINLRGYHGGEVREAEQKLVDELGVKYVELNLKANAPLPPELLAELIDSIEAAQTPLLVHCRHGIDRAGTASALAAMALGNMDFDKARWQAYVPVGPWKRQRKGNYAHVSDVLAHYEQFCLRNGQPTGGWSQFKDWVEKLE